MLTRAATKSLLELVECPLSHAFAPMIMAGRTYTSLSERICFEGRVGLVACPATRNLQVRSFLILIVEEQTRKLLKIVVAERDYRVALSEENLKASGLWAFVEERQGTPALSLDLLLPFFLSAACDTCHIWRLRPVPTNS